jgi:xylose isomerase
MYEILRSRGIAPLILNLYAKVRRVSFEPDDLFLVYIAEIDTFAKCLRIATRLLENGDLKKFVKYIYLNFD